MVLKELILTVSTLEGVVVLKELIFNSFYCWKSVVVLKELIFYSFYLEGCGGLERTDFYSFYWKGVVVFKELF